VKSSGAATVAMVRSEDEGETEKCKSEEGKREF